MGWPWSGRSAGLIELILGADSSATAVVCRQEHFVPSVTMFPLRGIESAWTLMSSRTKQRRHGGLTLLLYQRTLHPELFKILGSEQVSRRAYEADIWLVEGGHVIQFTADKTTLSEVIVVNNEALNDSKLLQSIQCRGEKYHEMTVGGNVRYMI